MKNEKFGYLGTNPDKSMIEMMQGDLESNDEFRLMMLHKIEGLLYGCFEFGINPLPTLRKVFPAYSWKYVDLTDKKPRSYRSCLKDIMMNSDFFWHTTDNGEGNHWVVAKKIGSTDTPARVFGNSDVDEQPDNVLEILRVSPATNTYRWVKDPTKVKLKNNRIMQ